METGTGTGAGAETGIERGTGTGKETGSGADTHPARTQEGEVLRLDSQSEPPLSSTALQLPVAVFVIFGCSCCANPSHCSDTNKINTASGTTLHSGLIPQTHAHAPCRRSRSPAAPKAEDGELIAALNGVDKKKDRSRSRERRRSKSRERRDHPAREARRSPHPASRPGSPDRARSRSLENRRSPTKGRAGSREREAPQSNGKDGVPQPSANGNGSYKSATADPANKKTEASHTANYKQLHTSTDLFESELVSISADLCSKVFLEMCTKLYGSIVY